MNLEELWDRLDRANWPIRFAVGIAAVLAANIVLFVAGLVGAFLGTMPAASPCYFFVAVAFLTLLGMLVYGLDRGLMSNWIDETYAALVWGVFVAMSIMAIVFLLRDKFSSISYLISMIGVILGTLGWDYFRGQGQIRSYQEKRAVLPRRPSAAPRSRASRGPTPGGDASGLRAVSDPDIPTFES